ncbi:MULTISPECIES: hypothetical protein [unclassified Chamaesiphon]|uniref:hypothetical protein n=1 Tax=unclassified Chamaesiphon TaxID=2620921 RepID=UPI00286A6771|nr:MULTISPECIES: hypothetical protein [unclassified Chamaesiphon]
MKFPVFTKRILEFMQNERDGSEIEIVQWLTELGVNWDGELADLQKLDLYRDRSFNLQISRSLILVGTS